MPITFSCECGKKFQVKDEFAGKQTKCPVCGKALMIPSAGGDELELEQQDLVRPSEQNKPKKKADVTLDAPVSNAGLVFGGAVVGVGVIAFLALLMGFLQGDGHDPYMLAKSTPIPGKVESTGPTQPVNPLANNTNGTDNGNNNQPIIEQKLTEYQGVTRLHVSTDGRTIVTNKGDEIIVWDVATETALRNLPDGHACHAIFLNRSFRFLLTVGPTPTGGQAKLWDLQDNKVLLTVPLQAPVAALGFSQDDTRAFVSNPIDGTIMIDVANAKAGPPLTNPWAKARVAAFNTSKNQAAFAYAASPNNPRLELVDLGSLKATRTISTDVGSGAMAYSNDGQWLAVVSAKTVVLDTADAGKVIAIPRTQNGRLKGKVAISADNRFLAGRTDDALIVWDLNTKLDRVITTSSTPDFAFMGDGRLVYTTGEGTLKFVQLADE